MRVLITGGMGVIGSMVSGRLVRAGLKPVLMARHLDRSLIGSVAEKADIELGDVLDLPRLVGVIKAYGVTHIIHMAALIGALSHQNPPHSVQVNVIGTLNVLEAARLFDVRRVVFTSAKGVYGHIGGEYGHPEFKAVSEDHPKNPIRIYESEKLIGEHMGEFYLRTYGLEFAALRFSGTFGPGKTVRHGDKAGLSRLVEGAFAGDRVVIEKGGDQRSDYVYNKDAAEGVYLACVAERLNHAAYNIGSGRSASLKTFAREVERVLPEARISVGPGIQDERPNYSCLYDISRAREDLGYAPRFTEGEAIEDYIETLRQVTSKAGRGGGE